MIPLLYLVGIAILLLVSALFSGTETAIVSLSRGDVEDLVSKNGQRGARVRSIASNRSRFLVAVLLGNTLANVGAAMLATGLALSICERLAFPAWFSVLMTIFFLPLVLLVIGEVTPKTVALFDARRFALATAPVFEAYMRAGRPLIGLLSRVAEIGKLPGRAAGATVTSPEELHALIRISKNAGLIRAEEQELIASVVDFGDTVAREIMLPRPDMVYLSVESTYEEVLGALEKSRHSRFPIVDDSVDDIVGLLHAKDMIKFIGRESEFEMRENLRTAYFVPEVMKLASLLRELKTQKNHMAIVVDEYGGTSGLVTLEDILEEIVGEIWDEHDEASTLHEFIDGRTLAADGRMDVEDLSELVGRDLEGDGYDTLAGLILDRLGDIPKAGHEFSDGELHFVVEKVVRNRIRRVRIHMPEISADSPPLPKTDAPAVEPASEASGGSAA